MCRSNVTNNYPELKDKVVLNVDDNEMNQLVLSKIMQNAGIKTIQAGNGEEAISHLQSGLVPDVILMDLEMPVMNGLQASEYIRIKIDRRIPIIVNSGSVSAHQRFRLNRLDIYDFLEKPYGVQDILSKLSKFMTPARANIAI